MRRLVVAFLVVVVLSGVMPAASADRASVVGYDEAEATDLYTAAAYLGMSPAELQVFGVQAARFVLELSRRQPDPVAGSAIPGSTGGYEVASLFRSGEQQEALEFLMAFYGVGPVQATRVGATFIVFLAGLDAWLKRLPYPQVRPPAPVPQSGPTTTLPPPTTTTTTTVPPTTTTVPRPSGQCTTWPKDATCWPLRDVPGTADYQFWTTHPCTVAYRDYYSKGTGPLPIECILTQGGKVADPTMVQWPLYPVYSWSQFWSRWGYHLSTTTERLMREAVTATPYTNGRWTLSTNCYRVIQAEQIVLSARYDLVRAGGQAWPTADAYFATYLASCNRIAPGVRYEYPNWTEADGWGKSVSDGPFDWYLLQVRTCSSMWNRREAETAVTWGTRSTPGGMYGGFQYPPLPW